MRVRIGRPPGRSGPALSAAERQSLYRLRHPRRCKRLAREHYHRNVKVVLARNRSWRLAHRTELAEYKRKRRLEIQRKDNIRRKVRRLVVQGKLKKKPCKVCGNVRSEAHHPDYRRPLYVVWLCHKHHMQEHRWYK